MRVEVSIGEPESTEGTIVLVDVVKSSTTIAVALDNGAKFIIPFDTVDKVGQSEKEWKNREDVVLAGETWIGRPKGFDMGISPQTMTKEVVKDKIIIYKSNNLTRILAKCKNAERLIIGGIINSRVVAEYLNDVKPEKVTIIACGTKNKALISNLLGVPPRNVHDVATMEDILGAGAIIHHLDSDDLSDMALISLLAYENPKWKEKVYNGCIIRSLLLSGMGFEKEIPYYFSENKSETVPIYIPKNNRIVAFSRRTM